MKLFRTIMAALTVIIEFIIFSPWMIYCKKLTKKGDVKSIEKRDRIAPALIRFMSGCVMWWCGAKVNVTGEENIPEGACVFAGNHQSNFDIIALLWKTKTMYGYLSKKEIGKIPFLKSWMENIDCVFIDRGNTRQSIIAIRETIALLKNNRSIYIFPEGTRSKCDSIGEFKSGTMMVATKAKVPVVPFLINGSYKLFEANGNLMGPANVEITFFPPIYTENMSREEANNLTIKIREMLIDKQKEQLETEIY